MGEAYLIDDTGEGDDMFEGGIVLIVERKLSPEEAKELWTALDEGEEEDEVIIRRFEQKWGLTMVLYTEPILIHLWEGV